MEDHWKRWERFWQCHHDHLVAMARRCSGKYGLTNVADDILGEVAAKGLVHPTVQRLLAKKPEEEVLKYVTTIIRHETINAQRTSRRSDRSPIKRLDLKEIDPVELRDEVRTRLRSPGRVLEVAPRFIKSLPGRFHYDLCAHESIEPKIGLLTQSRILDLMEREFALAKLLQRIGESKSRWRMDQTEVQLLKSLLEELEIGAGVLASLTDDRGDTAGDWGSDPLGLLIERLLAFPARIFSKAEATVFEKVAHSAASSEDFQGGVNPIGRALEEISTLHAALKKAAEGERRRVAPQDRVALGNAATEAATMYLVWSQYQPDLRGAVERLVGKEGFEQFEQATKTFLKELHRRKEGS